MASMQNNMVLLIAYGNILRRDDGAGFVLADLLEILLIEAGAGVDRIDSHQLTPELTLDIARENIGAVAFVDARAVSMAVDDLRVQIGRIGPAENASPSIGHHLDPAVLLTMTSLLFKKSPPAWLITVPGVDFGHGEGLSEIAQQAIERGEEELGRFAKAILSKGPSGLDAVGLKDVQKNQV